MKNVYLVRHSECLSNLDPHFSGPEDSLTENGLKQSVLIADRFKNIDVDVIYHSGILRAQKTAQEIEKAIGIKAEAKEFLKERRGAFSIGAESEAEDFDQLKLRLAQTRTFLEDIQAEHIVLVSHAFFLKAFAAYLIHADLLNSSLLANFDNALRMNNTGISKCVFSGKSGRWSIVSWNDLAHLAE